MKDIETRKRQVSELGYDIVSSFILPRQDWKTFYADMARCLNDAVEKQGMTPTFEVLQKEIDMHRQFGDATSYLCLLLRRKD